MQNKWEFRFSAAYFFKSVFFFIFTTKFSLFMHNKRVILDIQYFPPIEYFLYFLRYEEVLLEQYEHFQKQSYRNRCHINTAQGLKALSIPVLRANSKQLFKDVKIDYSQAWQLVHWRSLRSAYGKAPFFEYYADLLQLAFQKKEVFLIDFTYPLLLQCLDWLRLHKHIRLTESYLDMTKAPDNIACTDARSQVHPKKSSQNNSLYKPVAYLQHFGNTFVPKLSILDLLFCEGSNSPSILKQSLHPLS
jgi:hypothetical protein